MIFLSGEPPAKRMISLVVIQPDGRTVNVTMADDRSWEDLLSPEAFHRHWLPAIWTLKEYSERNQKL